MDDHSLITYYFTRVKDANPHRPTIANPQLIGSVNGGVILQLVDTYAAMLAIKYTKKNVVTASFDKFDFLQPVYVGDLLCIKTAINRVFTTSLECGAIIEAENLQTGEKRRVGRAYLTFVALDGSGKPSEIQPIFPQSEEERRRYNEAVVRREERLAKREKR